MRYVTTQEQFDKAITEKVAIVTIDSKNSFGGEIFVTDTSETVVRAQGAASVNVAAGAVVHLNGSARAFANEGAHVHASESAKVTALGGANVYIHDSLFVVVADWSAAGESVNVVRLSA